MPPIEYEAATLRAMFGKPMLPTIPLAAGDVAIAAQKLAGKLSISGVQPKLSMALDGNQLSPVAVGGQFILKPQTQNFAQLPENEYLIMTMAAHFGMRTPPCLLLELADHTPAYLVRRFDRIRKGSRLIKLACEDMHQLLGGHDKYAGSHEQIAQAIRTHCTFAPLELQRLFEATAFNFAVGNGDAHRKNFSLLTTLEGNVALSPFYDLASSRLVLAHEKDEMALTLTGKRSRLRRAHFMQFAEYAGIDADYAARQLDRLVGLQDDFVAMINGSLLDKALRERLIAILADRLERLAV